MDKRQFEQNVRYVEKHGLNVVSMENYGEFAVRLGTKTPGGHAVSFIVDELSKDGLSKWVGLHAGMWMDEYRDEYKGDDMKFISFIEEVAQGTPY